ncbi:flagellin N-terminal helical domain-containing protein [Lignipirellula cremea]|uniref:Flagellin n=1 Tax=Lignipirellula cremea TaxID=2528010 RepID=A0A518DSL9_9BACT|nr:flagellin [Lignipirellula cremea]QDU94837.1 B-type flagellin [Lignipirellula cremea]
MSRINTNVSSLIAQNTLQRSNSDLQTTLNRLSTGLRIGSGKDDPAGLIASEELRSDIIGVKKAITNSERANQLIATGDSALGQVSSLLNEIRGLVSEAANTGALSDDQIAANQLQIDSSLEAIDRVAQVTSFQGRRILDGSLDFITKGASNQSFADLKIDQANFGALKEIGVDVQVVSQATQGKLSYGYDTIDEDVTLEIGGSEGFEAFNFAAGSTAEQIAAAVNLVSDAIGVKANIVQQDAQAGSITLSSFGSDNDIVLTATEAGVDPGNIRVKYDSSTAGQALSVAYTAPTGSDPGTLTVNLATSAHVAAEGDAELTGLNNDLKFTSKIPGSEFNDVEVVFAVGGDIGDAATFAYDHNGGTGGVGRLTITIDDSGETTAAQLIADLAADADVGILFEADNVGESDGSGTIAIADAGLQATLSGGELGGAITSTANDIVAAINASGANVDLSAALATGNDGHDVVTDFQEFALTGSKTSSNALQFLAPDATKNIRFVAATPGQALGVDLTTDPEVTDFSTTVVQGAAADSSFSITAKTKGSEYDGVTINLDATAAADSIAYDASTKTLNINVTAAATAADVAALVNGDTFVNDHFSGAVFGGGAGAGVVTSSNTAVTAGGVTSEGTVIINLATNDNGDVITTANDLVDFFNDSGNAAQLSSLGISVSNANGSDGTGLVEATTDDLEFQTLGRTFTDANATTTTVAQNGTNARLTLDALNTGADYDGVEIVFENTATAGSETFSYDSTTKKLTVGIQSGVSTATQVETAFTSASQDIQDLFTLTAEGTGAGAVTVFDQGTTSGGVTIGGTTDGAALLGNEDAGAGGLEFVATDFGSKNFVSIKSLSGSFALTDDNGDSADRSTGTDLNARINGVKAVADGLRASINTSSLDISFALKSDVASGTTVSFSITGGGAQFQLGPDVVSNQQARLGIQSVNTSRLGGVSGRLFELRSGGAKSLANDVTGAAKVVDEVINQVTTLRGRLGAFQKTTLETNIFTLNDTLTNLTDAESSIRDADFAAESARLTRAQILVQSGTSVLGIANQNPQNVLSLLR